MINYEFYVTLGQQLTHCSPIN